jgi:membrane protein DedA with SNARE-associated domain
VIDRFFTGERARERLDWAKRFLLERGSYVLIIARFIPGGRTATTFTSGVVHLRWATLFAPFILVAAILWALYGALLGYLGGRLFRDQPIYALLLAFGFAAAVAGGAELWRWLRKRG